MEVRLRAVVDQVQLAVPQQQVGVARGAVDVGDEGVEPDDRQRQQRVGLLDQRVEVDRAGQVVERDVGAAAGADQVLDLRVGLGARQVRVEFDQRSEEHTSELQSLMRIS